MAGSFKAIKQVILKLQKENNKPSASSERPNIDAKICESSGEKAVTGFEISSPVNIITSSLVDSGNTEDGTINGGLKSDASSVCSGEWIMGEEAEDIALLESSSSAQQEGAIIAKENSKNLAEPSLDGNDLYTTNDALLYISRILFFSHNSDELIE